LEQEFLEIPIQSDQGDFDFVRAKQGGHDAPFISIYLLSRLQENPGSSKKLTDSFINMIEGIRMEHPDKFEFAHWASDSNAFLKPEISPAHGHGKWFQSGI
jgi:membrane dipeptidase